jgi:hypothetical protein
MILGISGLANSGKDTVADILVEHHGYIKVALADKLKRITKEVFAFSDDQLWGPSHFRNAPDERYPRADGTFLTPREALQQLGTQWGRACYENTWVDICIQTSLGLLSQTEAGSWYTAKLGAHGVDAVEGEPNPIRGVAIPDVRFRNEIEAVKGAGGRVIRVTRPGAGLQGSAGSHASETEQASIPNSEFDDVIVNDGTLDGLKIKVDVVLRKFSESR